MIKNMAVLAILLFMFSYTLYAQFEKTMRFKAYQYTVIDNDSKKLKESDTIDIIITVTDVGLTLPNGIEWKFTGEAFQPEENEICNLARDKHDVQCIILFSFNSSFDVDIYILYDTVTVIYTTTLINKFVYNTKQMEMLNAS